MLRPLASLFLAFGLTAPAGAAQVTPAEKVVAVFDAAMATLPNLTALERFATSNDFKVTSREMEGGQLSYIEAIDSSGDLYLVGIRDRRDVLEIENIRLLVTHYETKRSYAKTLIDVAMSKLPTGPAQKIDLSGGFSFGRSWEANYPDLISLQIKYHRQQRASLIEAHVVKIK